MYYHHVPQLQLGYTVRGELATTGPSHLFYPSQAQAVIPPGGGAPVVMPSGTLPGVTMGGVPAVPPQMVGAVQGMYPLGGPYVASPGAPMAPYGMMPGQQQGAEGAAGPAPVM